MIPSQVDGRTERLVYLSSRSGELAAYEELRAGFTAAVSHELRTPLARLLVLLENGGAAWRGRSALIAQARAEVGQIGELIDDVLFLSELETGREVSRSGNDPCLPRPARSWPRRSDRAARAGVRLVLECDEQVEIPSGLACCASSPRTCSRTRSATRARGRPSPSPPATRTAALLSRRRTTGRASQRR